MLSIIQKEQEVNNPLLTCGVTLLMRVWGSWGNTPGSCDATAETHASLRQVDLRLISRRVQPELKKKEKKKCYR